MSAQLPLLPYPLNALAPALSEETLQYHYGKHHQTYVNTLNTLIKGTPFEHMLLEEIVLASEGVNQAISTTAAQAWNHTFYWMSLSNKGEKEPGGELLHRIEETWGSYEKFREAFLASAVGNFGSGWTWLVLTPTKELKIVNTSNAGTALASDDTPLLVVDVWEHAYYIDYRNARADYVKALFDHLIDWGFVAKNYYAAR